MKSNICVAIPIKTNNYDENSLLIKKVLDEKPDFIELRFDFINDVENLTRELGSSLLNLVPPNISTIFTFRNNSEGGQIKLDKKERLKIIENLLEAQPGFIDIEMNSDKEVLNHVINLAIKNKVNLIFSYHDFEKTSSYKEALELILRFEDKLINRLIINANIVEKSIYKVIFTAQRFEDNLIPINICQYFSKNNKKIISFCMGEIGIFSRIICVKHGSFMTYCSLYEKTAPGQIAIEKLREFYDLLFEKSS
ncbi:MAG: type I 3-dehydroquinate dehydratase [Candidatus Hodarchaeota archaeon]